MAIRGGDTRALRAYNERLILQALRLGGPLSKAELARATGLSAQAASVIVNALVADGFLEPQAKIRGRVGQPMTPLALAAGGAYSVGVKLGRRTVDAALLDFRFNSVRTWRLPVAAPLRDETMAAARRGVQVVLEALPEQSGNRVIGLGIAMPSQIHLWAEELGLDPPALANWADFDPAADLAEHTGLPTQLHNDATAACAAEMALGGGAITASTLYVYIGGFVGGGLVLGGRLLHGSRGNAAAIGSMPTAPPAPGSAPRQLIHEASAVFLERALATAGIEPARANEPDQAPAADAVFASWANRAAAALAHAVAAAASLVDLETVVLDGVLAPRWRRALLDATEHAFVQLDRSGLEPLRFVEGGLGADARMLGAALLPLHDRFSPEPEILVRPAVPAAPF